MALPMARHCRWEGVAGEAPGNARTEKRQRLKSASSLCRVGTDGIYFVTVVWLNM